MGKFHGGDDAFHETPFAKVCGKCGAKRIDDQLGLEELHDCMAWASGKDRCKRCYVCKMVHVFRLLRRVLRDDGCAWLNLGDSYGPGKQLMGIPWRVAFALQADGWILRSDIPWVKRSPMPESCTDRPAKALEYVFMLAKTERCFFDMEAVKPKSVSTWNAAEAWKARENLTAPELAKGADREKMRYRGFGTKHQDEDKNERNFRNADLWFQSVEGPHGLVGVDDELVGLDVTSKGFPGAHFATFSPFLIDPLVRCGTSAKGVCPKCGAPWRRVLEKHREATRPGKESKLNDVPDYYRQLNKENPHITHGTGKHPNAKRFPNSMSLKVGNRDPERHVTATKTVGWEPTCTCNAGDPVPATVLDPFSGTSTTGLVAIKRGRQYIGCELNLKYAQMGLKRLQTGEGNRGLFG